MTATLPDLTRTLTQARTSQRTITVNLDSELRLRVAADPDRALLLHDIRLLNEDDARSIADALCWTQFTLTLLPRAGHPDGLMIQPHPDTALNDTLPWDDPGATPQATSPDLPQFCPGTPFQSRAAMKPHTLYHLDVAGEICTLRLKDDHQDVLWREVRGPHLGGKLEQLPELPRSENRESGRVTLTADAVNSRAEVTT